MVEQLSLLTPRKVDGPNVVYFDLETLRGADEVGGWSNIRGMGMACGVCFDSRDGQFHVYDEIEVEGLIAHLKRADLVVGFNHVRFDYEVLAGYSKADLRSLPNFDILEEVTRILGHRLKLDSIVRSTLGQAKSADGMQSLRWVKEGKFDLVREYCKKDVEVTRDLFLHGSKTGELFFERTGERVRIPVDWNVEKLIRSR
ncbi:MAG: DEAD/DEAH box helicase [Pseudomonadota bacterium]